MDPEKTAALAKTIEGTVNPQLADGLKLTLWGIDSLVADPVSIDIDDDGKLYYIRTNRQKNSEFDIRQHSDWEIQLIGLQSIDDKRKFLRDVLAPEKSDQNLWLTDVNKDGSHDWRDMTVEKEHVYRLEDTSGDGVADLSQLVLADFHDEVTDAAGAILAYNGDLFAGVAPDMWRLKDTNNDGLIDEKESISHGYGIRIGFSGHGMSGLEVGPEGKIYWQIGDIGFNGTGPDGKKWEHPNSGVIVRSNPDGSDFEVFAYGNRNTHEFVFDEYGNLISEDNDGDHPGERERIVYIVEGSDTGWRSNWQFGKYKDPDNNTYKVWMEEKMHLPRFEGQAAYFIPPIANFVNGPTGMLYNPGTALSPEWKNFFFIGEFVGNPSKSGIHAFKLKPSGATFELGETKMVLGGVLATGIDFGPDGAMYLADWIDGWGTKDHGRIWKLDVTETMSEERKRTQEELQADFDDYDEAKLSALLKNADMRVRQKAQFELVERGEKGLTILKENLEQKENQLARVHAIWGISQFARQKETHAKLLIPILKDNDPEIRAQAAKWLGDVRFKEAGKDLIPLLTDANSRVRFFAAEALGRIAYNEAIQPVIEMLRHNNDEDAYLRHAGSLALARMEKADPIIALAKDSSRAVRIAAVVALRRMRNPGIQVFLQDADEYIVTEAARAINDDLSISEALPALGDVVLDGRFTNEALLRRAINANLRVGNEKAMQNLITFTLNDKAPEAMRTEAIDALSTWAKPSVLDRVDGRYRGEITRDIEPLKKNSAAPLIQLIAHRNEAIRLHAVKALGKIKHIDASAQLFSRLKTDPSPEVRVAALHALSAMSDPAMDKVIEQALSDKAKSVRVVALDLIQKSDIDKTLMVSLLGDAINKGTTEEKQSALLTLGRLPITHTQKVFDQLLDKMEAGGLSADVHLELGEAVELSGAEALTSRYKTIMEKQSDTPLAAFESALHGGDAVSGRDIFFRHQTAQCMRCHSFQDFGGTAGPRLNGIANRLTREQLLQALIDPSARIAPGFGIVRLDLKDGKSVSGILLEESAKGLLLKIGDKPDTLIANTDVTKRSNSPSSMPPMNLLLTKREIRDLVSFLATLKDDE